MVFKIKAKGRRYKIEDLIAYLTMNIPTETGGDNLMFKLNWSKLNSLNSVLFLIFYKAPAKFKQLATKQAS